MERTSRKVTTTAADLQKALQLEDLEYSFFLKVTGDIAAALLSADPDREDGLPKRMKELGRAIKDRRGKPIQSWRDDVLPGENRSALDFLNNELRQADVSEITDIKIFSQRMGSALRNRRRHQPMSQRRASPDTVAEGEGSAAPSALPSIRQMLPEEFEAERTISGQNQQ